MEVVVPATVVIPAGALVASQVVIAAGRLSAVFAVVLPDNGPIGSERRRDGANHE